MSLSPIAIATKGYVCVGAPRPLSIAMKGYVCQPEEVDRREGDGGMGLRWPHGAVILEPQEQLKTEEDELLAILAVLAINEVYE